MYVPLEQLIFLAHVAKYLDTTREYGVKMPCMERYKNSIF